MHFSILEKAGFALLITAWLVWGSNAVGNTLVQAEPTQTAAVAATDTAPEPAPATESAPAAAEDALAMLGSADAEAGVKVFKKCKACHTTNEGGKNKVGPNLWDVVGRAKASASGYKFSDAMSGLGGEWSYGDLDAFLTAPKAFAKGTKMSYSGLKKASDRAAVILYLRSLSAAPKPVP